VEVCRVTRGSKQNVAGLPQRQKDLVEGSKFSKIFFEQLYTGWTLVVHLCCGFSLWLQMAPQQSAKLEPRFLAIFPTLRKDSVANYAWIWTLFRRLLEDWM